MLILGIDPGLTGGWALLSGDGSITAGDLPVVAGQIDAATFSKLVRAASPVSAFVEDVHSMPSQGVASTFTFGRAHGTVLGVMSALEVPIHMVSPTRWKKHFRLAADKEKARALALRLWPSADCFSRKKDHGRAEAALIARFGAETMRAVEERAA